MPTSQQSPVTCQRITHCTSTCWPAQLSNSEHVGRTEALLLRDGTAKPACCGQLSHTMCCVYLGVTFCVALVLCVPFLAARHSTAMCVQHSLRTSAYVSHQGPSIRDLTSAVSSQSGAAPSAVKLFVGVLSGSQNLQRRTVIRSTWGSDPNLGRVMFFSMRPHSNTTFVNLRKEAVEHGDVYIVSEVYEDYYNVTYSTLALFKAAAVVASDFTHVLKTDDDIYVRTSLLLPALQDMPRQWLYAGWPMQAGSVIRTPGWHEVPYSNWPHDTPVRYGYGAGYVLTMDIVREIAAGAAHMVMRPDNLLIIEDFATGLWVEHVGKERQVQITYNNRLKYDTSCAENVVFVHTNNLTTFSCMHSLQGACCT